VLRQSLEPFKEFQEFQEFIRNPISRAVFHGANQQYKKESTNVKNTIKYNKIGKTFYASRIR
jgi:hypothetical protein